jgi:Protein of unknown function (DUF3738)
MQVSPLSATAAAIAVPVVIGGMNPISSQAQSQPLPSSLPPDVAAMFTNTAFTKDAVLTPTQFKDNKFSSALFVLNGCLFIRNVQLKGLIAYAYGLPDFQISGTPEWANTQGYDLSLKLADTPAKAPGREAVQKLLEEQFKLVVHREIKDAAAMTWLWPTPKSIFNPPGHLAATDLDMAGLLLIR